MENSEKSTKNRAAAFLLTHKKEAAVILLALTGVILLIIGELTPPKTAVKQNTEDEYFAVGYYTEYLENKIEDICKSVGGITEAQVLLTLDCSSEYIYGESAADYVILQNDREEEAKVLREIYPRVRGIAVVCTGGDIPRVQETVTNLLSAAMGISSSKIMVAGN